MEFIDVKWHHGNQNDPVRFISELDAQRYETRKLEFFSNGTVGFASASESSGDTTLGVAPVPPISEINAEPQFSGKTISAAQFEALWIQHARHT